MIVQVGICGRNIYIRFGSQKCSRAINAICRAALYSFRLKWQKAMWGVDEPPYTLGEVARLLGVSQATAARLFDGEEGVLILSAPGARHKMRRIPRPVFNRVLNRLSQPKTASPYYPCKFRQPVARVLDYPQKARRYSEEDRRKMSEAMRRVWAAKKARRPVRAISVPLTAN